MKKEKRWKNDEQASIRMVTYTNTLNSFWITLFFQFFSLNKHRKYQLIKNEWIDK